MFTVLQFFSPGRYFLLMCLLSSLTHFLSSFAVFITFSIPEMLLTLLLFIPFCLAGNILVLNPTTGHSHVRFLGNLASLLADDGHNVVSLFSKSFQIYLYFQTVLSPIVDSSVKPFGTENPKVRKIKYYSPYVDTGNWQKLE